MKSEAVAAVEVNEIEPEFLAPVDGLDIYPVASDRLEALAEATRPIGNRWVKQSRQLVDKDQLLRVYKTEAEAQPLLDKEDEAELARIIEVGKEAEGRLEAAEEEGRSLGAAEKRNLREAIHQGSAARRLFIAANLLLVVSIVKSYRDSTKHLDELDLIQEGNLGLMQAVDRFDWRKGFKFSTFATGRIQQAIRLAIQTKDRLIHLPANTYIASREYTAIKHRLYQEMGRAPTNEEIKAQMGDHDRSLELIANSLETEHTQEFDRHIFGVDEFDLYLFDTIADVRSVESFENVGSPTDKGLMQAIGTILGDERLATIITERYGLAGEEPKLQSEIGEMLGLKKKQISDYEARARAMLEHPVFHDTMARILPNLSEDLSWKEEAACLGVDSLIVFPKRGIAAKTPEEKESWAKSQEYRHQLCGSCPVVQRCGALALRLRPDQGLWANQYYDQSKRKKA